jgi:hypothetical protein
VVKKVRKNVKLRRETLKLLVQSAEQLAAARGGVGTTHSNDTTGEHDTSC